MFQANSCIFHGIFKIHEKFKLIMSKISFRRGISENVNHENSIYVELSNDILENKTLIQAKWFQVSVWAVKLLWVFSHKQYNPVPQFPSREFAGSCNHSCTQDKAICHFFLNFIPFTSHTYMHVIFGFQYHTDYFFGLLFLNKTTGNFSKYYNIYNNFFKISFPNISLWR